MFIVTKKWPTATIRILLLTSWVVCLFFGTVHIFISLHNSNKYPPANADQKPFMWLPQSLRGGGNDLQCWSLKNENMTYTNARDAHTMKDTGFEVREHYFGRPKNNIDTTSEVTAVTQMSMSRFPRLLDLYSQWKGLISVALYLEMPDETTLKNITDLKNSHFGQGECNISFHLVINNGSYKDPYPINVLRNVAMDNAVTDNVLLIDVDFVPSPETHQDILRQLPNFDLSNQKQALVVPAFERRIQPGEAVVNASDLPKSKEALLAEMSKVANWKTEDMNTAYGAFWNYTEYRYIPFHRHDGFEGHKPTNFKKWFVASKPYKVQYVMNFEPYVVVNRQNDRLPRFWEYFTGYGLNKVSFFEELALANYTFHVLPSSFLVHTNHPFGSDRFLRPFVIQEYCRFQHYLRQEYNNSFWTPEELDARTKLRYEMINT